MWLVIDSPIGPLRLVAADGALTAIDFSPFGDRPGDEAAEEPVLQQAAAQLAEYFAG